MMARNYTLTSDPQQRPSGYTIPEEVITPVSNPPNKSVIVDGKHITFIRKLGKGEFGIVHEGKISDSNGEHKVAVKQFSRAANRAAMDFWKEMRSLSVLEHKNIIKCIGYDKAQGLLVMEYAEGGNLEILIRDHFRTLSIMDKYNIARDIAYGLLFMHSNNFIHNDIKLANILLKSDNHTMLGDLGIAFHKTLKVHVPANYKCAANNELKINEGFSYRVDIVGYANVLVALFTGNTTLIKYFERPENLPRSLQAFPWLQKLVQSCLNFLKHQDVQEGNTIPDIASILIDIEKNSPRYDDCWDIEQWEDFEEYQHTDPELASLIWRLDEKLLSKHEVRMHLVGLMLNNSAPFEARQAAKKKLITSTCLTLSDYYTLLHDVMHNNKHNTAFKFDPYLKEVLASSELGRLYYTITFGKNLPRLNNNILSSFDSINKIVNTPTFEPDTDPFDHNFFVEFIEMYLNFYRAGQLTNAKEFMSSITNIKNILKSEDRHIHPKTGSHRVTANALPHLDASIHQHISEHIRRMNYSRVLPIPDARKSNISRSLDTLVLRTQTDLSRITVLNEILALAPGDMSEPFEAMWGIINSPDESDQLRCASLQCACKIALQCKYDSVFKRNCAHIPQLTPALELVRNDVLAEFR